MTASGSNSAVGTPSRHVRLAAVSSLHLGVATGRRVPNSDLALNARSVFDPNGRRGLMAEQQIRFDDGAAYERMMGTWSRLVGEIFLDWLAPRSGLRWIDIGCGNGAFTQLRAERCAPAEVQGIDPSERQLAFARVRPATRVAEFRQG